MLNMRKKAKPFADVSKEELTDYYLDRIFTYQYFPDWNVVWQEFGKYMRTKEVTQGYKHSPSLDEHPYYYDVAYFGMEGLKKDPVFVEWLKDIYIPTHRDRALEDLSYSIDVTDPDKPIPIYRAMLVRDNYIDFLAKQGKHLGIFWSSSIDRATIAIPIAQAFKGREDAINYLQIGDARRQNRVILESAIDPKYVDWHHTVYTRSRDIGYPMEEEITLFKGTPIKILGMYGYSDDLLNLKALDITPIQGMTFYA